MKKICRASNFPAVALQSRELLVLSLLKFLVMKARVCQFFLLLLRIMTSKVIFRPKSDNTRRNEGVRKNEWRSSFQNRKSLWEQKSTSQDEIPQLKTRPHSFAQVSSYTFVLQSRIYQVKCIIIHLMTQILVCPFELSMLKMRVQPIRYLCGHFCCTKTQCCKMYPKMSSL